MSTDATEARVRQAPDEIARGKIVAVTLVSLVTTAVALVAAWLLLERWGQEPRRGRVPPAPRTIGILEQTLVLHSARGIELRDEQAASLSRWRWVDRDGGLAQIPIETALDVLATSPPPPDRPLADLAVSSGSEGPR